MMCFWGLVKSEDKGIVARGVTNPSVLINEERVQTPSILKRLLRVW